MKYTISGKNITVTDGLKDNIIEKIGKLERYFSEDTEAQITLSVQKNRQKIEVTIPVKGGLIRAEETSTDMYTSIDLVEETIERQLKRYRKKLTDHHNAGQFSSSFADEAADEDDGIQIVRTKKFGIKPMDPEEACLQMELLGHSFYVFSNSETDEINVVYKRKNGTFGLIEPTFE